MYMWMRIHAQTDLHIYIYMSHIYIYWSYIYMSMYVYLFICWRLIPPLSSNCPVNEFMYFNYAYIYIYIYMYTCMWIHTCTCIYMCVMHTHINMCKYTCYFEYLIYVHPFRAFSRTHTRTHCHLQLPLIHSISTHISIHRPQRHSSIYTHTLTSTHTHIVTVCVWVVECASGGSALCVDVTHTHQSIRTLTSTHTQTLWRLCVVGRTLTNSYAHTRINTQTWTIWPPSANWQAGHQGSCRNLHGSLEESETLWSYWRGDFHDFWVMEIFVCVKMYTHLNAYKCVYTLFMRVRCVYINVRTYLCSEVCIYV